jgi:hypothetical protein
MTNKPLIVCLTPVKNEEWILDIFLKSTSIWADYIIIADQLSTDKSVEIALKYSKVILVENNSIEFNEVERQRMLLNEARKIKGDKLIITLDSDEIFTPNTFSSNEWKQMLNAPKGTAFKFQLLNVYPGWKKYWEAGYFALAYMDDNLQHTQNDLIHTTRIPYNNQTEFLVLKEIKILHLQFTNWSRMTSKHRWYQCYELLNYPNKSPIEIYRRYHHMFSIKSKYVKNFPKTWLKMISSNNIDINLTENTNYTYFDKQCEEYFSLYGINFFKKLVIWNKQFLIFSEKCNKNIQDPRSTYDKTIHFYLKYTQYYSNSLFIRFFDLLIKKIY